MQNTFQLSIFYFLYLLKKRVVINCVLILLVLGFFLIPNQNANYVTLYLGNVAALTNKFWIGNLAAIFSNFIISFLLLFVIIGEREKEILQHTFSLEDTSPIIKLFKNGYKVLALFYISLFFLLVLNLSLIIANYKQIDLLYFIMPLFYFSISYLFVLSVFTYFVEYFIKKKIKYFMFFLIFILFLILDHYLLDLFGIEELHSYIGTINKTSSDFAIGYMSKTALSNIIVFNKILMPKFIYKKVLWIFFALLFIILFSKKNISRKLSIAKESHLDGENYKPIQLNEIKFTQRSVANDLSFKTLFLKDFYLFSNSFSKSKITYISLIWFLLLIVPTESFHNVLLPLIFLFCLFINGQFLCKLHFYNLGYLEKIAPFNSINIFLSKFLIIFMFYTILLIPHFIKIETNVILLVLLNFLFLTSIQVLISNVLKNNILLDILIISVFASYLTGTPIINILQL